MTKTLEATGLLPQRPRFVRDFAESSDYILEPFWRGTRALVRLGPDPVASGYNGGPVDVARELLDAIAAVADCQSAVIDGVIVRDFLEEADLEGGEAGEGFQRIKPARDIFMAVDLLEVDGVSLLEAPLLERKRHLAGLIRPSTNVRLTPFVRRGMRAWKDTLEGQGFKRFIVKKVNSRYRPGATNDDWLEIEKL